MQSAVTVAPAVNETVRFCYSCSSRANGRGSRVHLRLPKPTVWPRNQTRRTAFTLMKLFRWPSFRMLLTPCCLATFWRISRKFSDGSGGGTDRQEIHRNIVTESGVESCCHNNGNNGWYVAQVYLICCRKEVKLSWSNCIGVYTPNKVNSLRHQEGSGFLPPLSFFTSLFCQQHPLSWGNR